MKLVKFLTAYPDRRFFKKARILLLPLKNKSRQPGRNSSEASKMLSISALQDVESVLESLGTSLAGLPEFKAKSRLKQFGQNEVAHKKPPKWYMELLVHFQTPFNLLLIGIALISYLTDSVSATIVIILMVLLSVFLRFIQEARSGKAAERLQALVSTTATVYRRPVQSEDDDEDEDEPDSSLPTESSVKREIPLKYLVPGDIIHLSSGDMIPADVRVISSKNLLVSEAALTGEAIPNEKTAVSLRKPPKNPLELPNVCFMGTNVISGTALAVVVLTGDNTFFGSLAKNVVEQDTVSSFDQGVNALSWLLIRFILVLVSLILLINGLNKGNWLEALMFALSVAVGLTPEMLPMIIASNLAKGALAMSKKKVIVKRLNAIQNFGAMDVLCTDKTGTLTQNRIILDKHLNMRGEEDMKVLQYAYLNSYHQTGLKNLLDEAVLQHADELASFTLERDYQKVDEIPFDFERRRMSVVVEKDSETHLLICKGAVDEIFQVSTHFELDGERSPINADFKNSVNDITRDLNEDGFRVIALAYKEIPSEEGHYMGEDESGLTLLGYVSFLDPPKETASPAISALKHHGVEVKILTGDNDTVTRKVCRDVGLDISRIILGSEVETLSEPELAQLVDSANVFAKLTPRHKERIIRALRQKGHVVGFMGDGINDAPALKAADVGISVDSAVDIAKESADIILLEKSLLVLESGVLEGRMVFGNIMKYIRMTTSSNFGNVFSMVGASALLPFLPMLPIHILIQNLLYDFSQVGIPLDKVDEEYLFRPRKWEIGNISRYMFFFGPISSLFDYITFALLWFVFGANSTAHQSLFQSGWFVEGLVSQTVIIHMLRTSKIPFVESTAALPLTILTVLVLGVGIYLPFSPLAHQIGFQALPLPYFGCLILIIISYCTLVQLVKQWFIRRFGYN